MRPARTILIMQLSNSRAGIHLFIESASEKIHAFLLYVMTSRLCYALTFLFLLSNIFPSLTVEKKNECHNP